MVSNFQPFVDFHKWADDNRVTGTDGSGKPADFIPLGALRDYWKYRISDILNSCNQDMFINVSHQDVADNFLRIFSVLVYISQSNSGRVNYIKNFLDHDIDDDLLPFSTKPEAFPRAHDGSKTFDKFNKEQYLFCPVELDLSGRHTRRNLHAQSVWPFTMEQVLAGREGVGAIIKKCKLHPSSGLKVPNDIIVVKEFSSSELETSFKKEVESYTSIKNKIWPDQSSRHFLQYYGSFYQDGKGLILLEYAGRGSLLEFFQGHESPYEREELVGLWTSLRDLFLALEVIHGLDPKPAGTIRGVHQDLKPSNIFVFQEGGGGAYPFRFKIGDFGMSSNDLVKSRSKWTRSGADNIATRAYGAPELTHYYPELNDLDYGATWEVDIWSLGCVLCEILVWTICGWRGVSEFLKLRQEHTKTIFQHESNGYLGCFHDGRNRIAPVDTMMERVLKSRRVFDDLSEPISRLILEEMLISKPDRRLDAKTILPRFEKILAKDQAASHTVNNTNSPGDVELETSKRASTHAGHHERDATSMPHDGNSRRLTAERDVDRVGNPAWALVSPALEGGRSRPEATPLQSETSATWRTPPLLDHRKFQEPEDYEAFHPRGDLFNIQTIHGHQEARAGHGRQRATEPPGSTFSFSTRSPSIHRETGRSRTVIETPNSREVARALTPSAKHNTLQVPPSQSTLRSRVSSLTSTSINSIGYQNVTVPQVLEWIEKKKRSGGSPAPLLELNRAMGDLKDREQIFVIDDSDTMRSFHWDDVTNTFKALAYLVKSVDPNGVEVVLTSNPRKVERGGKNESTSLVDFLRGRRSMPPNGTCNMEDSLRQIFEKVKEGITTPRKSWFSKQAAGVSVYILTDAIWEGEEDGTVCGVDGPIESLVRYMQEKNKGRSSVALQFIQFGDSVIGKQRLKYLDDDLARKLPGGFDIVDHRHSQKDGVWHMLVGSVSRKNDRDN